MPITICCKVCEKEIKIKPSKLGKRVYCSRECMATDYRGNRLIKTCESCGKDFEIPDRPSRKNARFCSKACMGIGQTAEKHWNYQHGQRWLPEVKKLYFRKYYEEHKEEANQRSFIGKIKRRQMNIEGSHTFLEWIELIKKHDNKCYYCGVCMTKKMEERQRTRDHIIPISRGGRDDMSNIVPACRSCNSSKGNKTLEEWKGVTVIETAPQGVKGVE
jgi:5-methylcytosine-specific restriction endonuclease McrA